MDGPVLMAYLKEAEKLAKEKLKRIIELEGDSNGERLKPYYLEYLKNEIMEADICEKVYGNG